MYSKKYINSDAGYSITPPPGYDGSRFGSRSDGRDDGFPPYNSPPQVYMPQKSKQKKADIPPKDEGDISDKTDEKKETIFPFLKEGIGQEELLIIALLIVLVSEKNISNELILMLGLLLCI